MDENKFINDLSERGISLNTEQLSQFQRYFHLLVEWNEKVNLTAITEEEDVYLKHFYDSITPSFYFDFNQSLKVCDVGAGAGFPSIPLLICYPHLEVTIIDSLKKRITFLEKLALELNLKTVTLIHGRAEEIGRNKKHREKYNVVTARAVARTNVLAEYCLPLTKVGGHFIALKGSYLKDEEKESENAIKKLGGHLKERHEFKLPIENSDRNILIIDKVEKTAKPYPRKAGTPSRRPIT